MAVYEKQKRIFVRCITSILLVAIFLIILFAIDKVGSVSSKETLKQIETTIERSVVCYYAIYGVYPANYNELLEFSNLQIDSSKYLVHYDIFATNVFPEVRVVEK